MRILCPLCGFAREIDEAKIPRLAQMATCPRCEHKFRFRVVDDQPPAGLLSVNPASVNVPTANLPTAKQTPGGPASAGDAPDPMAAQRAAAERAWSHIQGVKPDGSGPDGSKPTGSEPDASKPVGSADGIGVGRQPDAAKPSAAAYLNAPPGAARPEAAPSPVPFEDLPRFGFFPGLWGTITATLKTPAAFFRSMPVTGGMAKPLIFHLLMAEFMVLCQYLWSLTSLGALSQYTGSQELMDLGLNMAGIGPALILGVYPLLLIVRLLLMTGVIHLILRAIFRLSGGQGSGIEATFRVLCYSAAPLILGVIPFFGPLLGGVWSIGLTVIGLREAHRTRGSVAMFAVFLPILMLLAAALGLLQAGVKG